VRERNLPGGKGNVQERNIAEDGDEDGLEAHTKVTEAVDHTLLGKGEVSSLADHQISPLDANDGDQVAGLSEFEGLSGVADGHFGDDGESVHPWEGFVLWFPAASGIGLRTSERLGVGISSDILLILYWSVRSISVSGSLAIRSVRVVETNVNSRVHVSIPTEELGLIVVGSSLGVTADGPAITAGF